MLKYVEIRGQIELKIDFGGMALTAKQNVKQTKLRSISGVKRNRRLLWSSVVITTQDKKIWVTSDLHSKLHGIVLGGAAV